MGRIAKTQLEEKHWKALKLLEEGKLSLSEIASEMGWDDKYFYWLRNGNTQKGGQIAALFCKEWKEIEGRRESNIKNLVEENTETAQNLIKRVLAEITSKSKLTPEDRKVLSMYTNALARCKPNVSVGSVSFSYTKGLSAEDLVHEFKRLKGVAEQSFDRRGVSAVVSGGSGDISEAVE